MKFERVYTSDEVAQHLRCCRDKVYALLKNGQLKSKKVGNAWLVSQSNLVAFMNNPEPASTRERK